MTVLDNEVGKSDFQYNEEYWRQVMENIDAARNQFLKADATKKGIRINF